MQLGGVFPSKLEMLSVELNSLACIFVIDPNTKLDSFEVVFGIARSLRNNVENSLHVLVAVYFAVVGTLAANMALGLPPILG